ncbi:MAG: recombinase family protein [Firmicutes bacterium]|nr:recombinase family protein [Bacillota bacterium]
MAKFAVYSRKSKYTQKGESIKSQISLCIDYIKNVLDGKDGDIFIYEDEGFSGKSLDRPGFSEMMRQAEKGIFSYIIVYRLDRISRNIRDFAVLTEKFDSLGIKFISIKENFDTSSPAGRAMMYISSVFSQLERETISERIKDNMKELAKTGRWLGGVTPFGFVSQKIDYHSNSGKSKRLFVLKNVPEETETVELIFRKFIESKSVSSVREYLLQKGYSTRNGKHFSAFTIKNILSNPVYMTADADAWDFLSGIGANIFSEKPQFDGSKGLSVYNRTIQRHGKANKQNPPDLWIVAVGNHKGIISGKVWIKANRILEQKTHSKTPSESRALLSGILFCGECGSKMRPKTNGKYGFSYICTQKEKSRKTLCSASNAKGRDLDESVLSEVFRIPEDANLLVRKIQAYKKSLTKSKSFETHEKNMEFAEKNINRLISFEYMFENLTLREKRNILWSVIKKVTFYGNRACVVFREKPDFWRE